jgi:hypothetical protein
MTARGRREGATHGRRVGDALAGGEGTRSLEWRGVTGLTRVVGRFCTAQEKTDRWGLRCEPPFSRRNRFWRVDLGAHPKLGL